VRNSLDTLPPESSRQGAMRNPPPEPKNQNPLKATPPKRKVRYKCDYCHREDHLVEFCYRRLRVERREME